MVLMKVKALPLNLATALYRPLNKGVYHVRQDVDNCIEQWFWRIHFERLQSYNCKS